MSVLKLGKWYLLISGSFLLTCCLVGCGEGSFFKEDTKSDAVDNEDEKDDKNSDNKNEAVKLYEALPTTRPSKMPCSSFLLLN